MKIASGCPEDPYGFTGKEEDKAVGLHYFGARYYSSYLGRWLSPDPPVVHGGGLSNHYNYGGNSPYIYVDPDGNWIHIVIAAAVGHFVGGVTSFISAMKQDKSAWGVIKATWYGAQKGAAIAAAGAAGGPWAGAGAAATFASAETLAAGGSVKDAFIQGNMAFGMSIASYGVGSAVGSATQGVTGSISSATGQKIAAHAIGYTSSVLMAYGTTAISGGVNKENWDEILINASASYVAGAVGGGIEQRVNAGKAGMGGGPPKNAGAVGSAGDDAGYSTRGNGYSPVQPSDDKPDTFYEAPKRKRHPQPPP